MPKATLLPECRLTHKKSLKVVVSSKSETLGPEEVDTTLVEMIEFHIVSQKQTLDDYNGIKMMMTIQIHDWPEKTFIHLQKSLTIPKCFYSLLSKHGLCTFLVGHPKTAEKQITH
jgi:hypothetical protein